MFSPSPASYYVASGRQLPSLHFIPVIFNWDEHTYTINIWGHKLPCPLGPGRYVSEAGLVGSAASGRAHGHVQRHPLWKSSIVAIGQCGHVARLYDFLGRDGELGFYVIPLPFTKTSSP